jgi:hypothetical protein
VEIGPRNEAEPVIVLDVPEDFHQVPLDRDVERRTAAQLAVLERMGLSDRGQREALSLYLEALAGRLSEDNVVGTAFCLVALDGRPSTATFTVALQPTHSQDRGLVAMGVAEAMNREGRYQSVRLLELGQHPAVVAVAERPTVAGDSVTGEVGTTLRELCVVVPVPNHEQAVMVTLSTPCLNDWEVYESLVLDVCRSLHVQSADPDLIR